MNLKRLCLSIVALTVPVSMCAGQSIADVARQERAKKQQKTVASSAKAKPKVYTDKAKPKVYTDEDMSNEKVTGDSRSPSAQPQTENTAAAALPTDANAEQRKQRILEQKRVLASLQEQIDKLNASIHYVEANLYYNGPQYNQHQHDKEQMVQRLEKKKEAEVRKLQDLQEAARKAGFGSSVYDPNN